MHPKDIEDLFERYNNGSATSEERALIESWYSNYSRSDASFPREQLEEDHKESLANLLIQIQDKPKTILWPRLVVAAAILVFLTATIYFFNLNKAPQKQQIANSKPIKHDAAPGGNKAIITLGDGTNIVLNSAKIGEIASQGNTVIRKTNGRQISYSSPGTNEVSGSLIYNTATTPRGGQYQFILADGTKVWLNAASSIKYPVEFKGSERKVELTGEAYFEVAHNAKMPFRVIANGQTVEVLGTHFNVSAYSDEAAVKTTLLEGSVKVSASDISSVIIPGEQAQFKNGSFNIADVDVDEAVAWKNGFFNFKDANLEDVMRQISRWYDLDVKYDGVIPHREFSGEISRNVNASQILDILSFKKIHFKINGKILTITQ